MADAPIETRQASWLFVTWLARGIVSVLIALSAIEKINHLAGFARSIRDYELFPAWSTNAIAYAVPWIELFAAVMLLTGWWRREARWILASLLGLYTLLKVLLLALGRDVGCGCFAEGSFLGQAFAGPWGIVANVMLLACLGLERLGSATTQAPAADADVAKRSEPLSEARSAGPPPESPPKRPGTG